MKRIEQFVFPSSIAVKIQGEYPHLTDDQTRIVMQGLREYFQICLMANRRMVSMPSKVIDLAWHEFILFTRNYQQFCHSALGRFLHHTPAEAMKTPTLAQDGIKRAWRLACGRARINPTTPSHLPLIFAIDSMLAIPGGYYYSLNCQLNADYCAAHINCGGGCSGSSASSGCSGDAAGGGSGCSGGCGGGD